MRGVEWQKMWLRWMHVSTVSSPYVYESKRQKERHCNGFFWFVFIPYWSDLTKHFMAHRGAMEIKWGKRKGKAEGQFSSVIWCLISDLWIRSIVCAWWKPPSLPAWLFTPPRHRPPGFIWGPDSWNVGFLNRHEQLHYSVHMQYISGLPLHLHVYSFYAFYHIINLKLCLHTNKL